MTCEPCYSTKYNPLLKETLSHFLGLEEGIKMLCQILKVDYESIITKSRRQIVVQPRQMIMFILSTQTKYSLKTIGEAFSRDHTTVIHARETVRRLCRNEPEYRDEYEYLKNKASTFIKKI